MLAPMLHDAKPFSPERNLLASIVERAIYDIKSPDPLERRTSYAWLTSDETHEWSYLWVMEWLDLTPCNMRLIKKVKILRAEVALRDMEADRAPRPRKQGKFDNIFLV